MTAIHGVHRSETATRLHLAFELGWSQWKLAFTIGHGQPPRMRTIQARDLQRLLQEIVNAKRRFDLPENAELVSCYEAGRDGFWLHRWLTSQGIANVIVDSASIEVNRRRRSPAGRASGELACQGEREGNGSAGARPRHAGGLTKETLG